MAALDFQCSVITPEGQVYDGRAEFVVLPAHDGEIGILRNRAPLLARLGVGRLRVVSAGQDQHWYIDGGFAQVLDNHVVVLTQKALRPEEIDIPAAQAALDEARHMPVTDEASLQQKSLAQARARTQLRLAR